MGLEIIELDDKSNEVSVPESDIPVTEMQKSTLVPMSVQGKRQTVGEACTGRPFFVERVTKKN